MSTRIDTPRQAPDTTTHVADMPPLTVTTTGIPEVEHVQAPPVVHRREERTRWYALAFSGVLAVIAVLALVWNALYWTPAPVPSTTTAAAVATSEWPPRLTPSMDGYWAWGSTMSEWPPRLTPSTDGYAAMGSTMSEWPPRLTPSTDGYSAWGSTLSEWPPRQTQPTDPYGPWSTTAPWSSTY